MSPNDWLRNRPLVLVIGLLIVYGIIALHNQYCESGGRYNCAQEQAANSLDRLIVIETPPAVPDPDRDEWRDEQDLQAQRSMAVWARWMALFSLAAVFVTAAGVWFVRDTLVATREMVREAQRGTAAANRAADETRRIGEAQVRAYLGIRVEDIEVELLEFDLNYFPHLKRMVDVMPDVGDRFSHQLVFRTKIKNAGSSPARNISYALRWTSKHVMSTTGQITPTRSRMYFRPVILGAGDQWTAQETRLPIDRNEIHFMNYRITVDVSITYKDVFGEIQTDGFSFHATFNNKLGPAEIELARNPDEPDEQDKDKELHPHGAPA